MSANPNQIQALLQMLAQQQGQQPAQQMSQQGQFNPADIQAGLQGGPQPFSFAPVQGGVGRNIINALANAGKAATYVAEDPRERQADDARAQQLWETKQKMSMAAGEFGQREKDRAEAAAQRKGEFSQKELDRANALKIAQMGKDTEASRLEEEKRHNLATEGKPIKPDSPEQQFIDWYLQSHQGKNVSDAVTAYTKAHTPPEKEPKQLAVAPDGTVVELKPGSKVPQGTQTLQGMVKQQQADEGKTTAVNYANDYLQRKTFTGPGDEALMEKFFEMAKPTSGFRMTEAQMGMLRNAQSWFNSFTAKARHATVGTYFSDEQRQQIVDTMNNLGKAGQQRSQGASASQQQQQANPFAQFGGQVRPPQ